MTNPSRINPFSGSIEVELLNERESAGQINYAIPRQIAKAGIFAGLLDRALGEFLQKSMICAAIKSQYADAHLSVYYHNDRPYKRDILALNPHIDSKLEVGAGNVLPLEFFHMNTDREVLPGSDDFIKRGYSTPDILLTPSMLDTFSFYRFEHVPYFRVPPERVDDLDQRLVDMGVDPIRWFCCIFYREPGYEFRSASQYRDVSHAPFLALTEWIIREAGGQVLRIGHPTMTRFPEMPGFIDTNRLENDFMLQAHAASRSRFAVVTSAGPAPIFPAFGIPYAVTNAIGLALVLREGDLVLPRPFVSPDGKALDLVAGMRDGSWNESELARLASEEGYRGIDNSPEELIEVARMLMEQTDEISGWRPHRDHEADLAAAPKPDNYAVPEPVRRGARVVRFPDLESAALDPSGAR